MHLAYRVIVAAVGVGIIILAASIGWLPGPGGIPLALVGLAILASEFVWAHHLLGRARRGAGEFARWSASQPPSVRRMMGAGTAAGVVVGFWVILAIAGIPPWLPNWMVSLLDVIPGLAPA